MSLWVRNLVMIATLLVWGVAVIIDVWINKNRPDPTWGLLPVGVFTGLLVAGRRDTGNETRDPPPEDKP